MAYSYPYKETTIEWFQMTIVCSVVFSKEKPGMKAVFFLLVWLFCWKTGFAYLLYGQISVIHKLYQQGLCCRGERRKE